MAFLRSFQIQDKYDNNQNRVTRIAGDINLEGIIYAKNVNLVGSILLHFNGDHTLINRPIKFINNKAWVDHTYLRSLETTPDSSIEYGDADNFPRTYDANELVYDLITPNECKSIYYKGSLPLFIKDAMMIHSSISIQNIEVTTNPLIPLYVINKNNLISNDKFIIIDGICYCNRNTKITPDADLILYEGLLDIKK